MKRSKGSRLFISLMAIIMLVGGLPAGAFAAQPSDIKDHWARGQIETWLDKGLARGYPDGTFRPDKAVTRAEFITFSNQAFAIPAAAEKVAFTDVSKSEWYYENVAAAKKADYISGYPDGTFRPNNPISRQEAAAAVAGLLKLKTGTGRGYSDHGKISPWALGAVEALSAAGIMGGYPDASFRPHNFITRAEALATLQKGIEYKEPVEVENVFDKPGTYGPEEDMDLIEGDATIKVAGVTLQNTTITGNLLLAKGIEEGDVTLINVRVQGDTIVKGGGADSINVKDSRLARLIIDKEGVRIIASGNTQVTATILESGATLISIIEKDAEGFKQVDISKVVPPHTEIKLKGDFIQVNIKAVDIKVEITAGSVKELNIEAPAEITGKGKITTANIEVNGIQMEQEPQYYYLADDVTAIIAGEEVDESKPEEKPAPIVGGPGVPSKQVVSAISVTGDAVAGKTLTAKTTPTNAKGNYQWFRAGEDDGEYTEIDGATAKTYTLTNEDVGSYIKVTIKGTGSYKGTVTSDPFGKVEQPAKSTYKFTYEIPEGDVVAGVSVELPVTTEYDVLGDEGYDSVLIRFEGKSTEGDAEVTFKITEHGTNKDYEFEGSGQWGPSEGWPLPAGFSSENTWTLIFPEAGDYTISFWLEDLDVDVDEEDKIIVEASEEVTVREPEHSEYEFKIGEEHQALTVLQVDQLIEGNFVEVPADENVSMGPGEVSDNALTALATALNSGYGKDDMALRLVKVTLKATDIKELDYENVRIEPLTITKGGENTEDLQVWMYASQHDKIWWNVAKTGWGSEDVGFKLDPNENSLMKAYVFGKTPGIYEIKFKAVDINNSNEDEFIAEGTAMVVVKAAEISVSPLAKSRYEAGDTLEFTISGLNPDETEDVEVNMAIHIGGGGYPWADQEVLKDMVKKVEGGVLTVEGKVQPGLEYGKLIIGLPAYGYPRDSGLEPKDMEGNFVYVGEPTP